MVRWGRIAVIALVVLVVADVAVRLRSHELLSAQTWSSPELQFKERQVDRLRKAGGASVVGIGSSVIDVSFDPAKAVPPGGRPAYNAGVGGGSMAMIDAWAREVVVPKLHPDTVVFGLVSRELNPNDPQQQILERNFFRSRRVHQLEGKASVLERSEQFAEDNSALFRYRFALRQPKYVKSIFGIGKPGGDDAYGALVDSTGQFVDFEDRTFSLNPNSADLFNARALKDWQVGPRQVATLDSLLAFLKANVRQVIVVAMPVTDAYVQFHPKGQADQDAFLATVRASTAKAGVRLVEGGVWPSDLFADPAHMNGKGSARFTDEIAADLRG